MTWYVPSISSILYSAIDSLFLQDGTLTDSIAAVEAAWGKVAQDIGQDPEYIIAATHGKRAIDNLAQFKPSIKAHEMDAEVQAFEESILFFADAFAKHGPSSRQNSPPSSGLGTPALSPPSLSSNASSSSEDLPGDASARRPSFLTRVSTRLAILQAEDTVLESAISAETVEDWQTVLQTKHQFEAWQVEAAAVDRSVRILPGVKKLMDSIPAGRYAVATSGARTYGKSFVVCILVPPADRARARLSQRTGA